MMGDIVLLGALRCPIPIPESTLPSVRMMWKQLQSRARQAADRIEEDADEIERLRTFAQFIVDGYDNQDLGHEDFRVGAYTNAIKALDTSLNEHGDDNAKAKD